MIGSLISGTLGTAANMMMQNQAQKHQEKMYEKQKDFWFEQQDYNSPTNQVDRLRDAGINPALALGNIQSGSLGTAPTPVGSQANAAGNFGNITDSVMQVLTGRSQMRKNAAEEQNMRQDAFLKEIDGYTRFYRNMVDIAEVIGRTDKHKADALKARIEGDATDLLSFMQYNKGMAETAEIASRNEMNWLNYARGLQELRYLPTSQAVDFIERMTNIANTEARTESEKQRKKLLIKQTIHEHFRGKGQKFVNSLNNKIEHYMIEDARVKADLAPYIYGPNNMYNATHGIGYQASRPWKSNEW